MKNRIVIDKLNDGHVIVDQQQLSNDILSGNAAQRKRARTALLHGEIKQAWRKVKRTIFRSGHAVTSADAIASGVTILPFGSAEIADIAAENEAVAADSTCFAFDIAEQIDAQNAAFAVKPLRNFRVVFVDADSGDPLEYL